MKTVKLAQELIKRKSLTPLDAGCQDLMIKRLKKIGFQITRLKFGTVNNFFAIKNGIVGDKVFMFAGHTDVVSVGDEKLWQYPPFSADINDNFLYGRGAADMKGSLAAMIISCETFIVNYPKHQNSIAFLITSDEEGIATNGTIKVCEYLQQQQQKIDYCLIGEPSSVNILGDNIKNGRRGSLNGFLNIIGKQGHIAYPHLANNPIHLIANFLNDFINIKLDKGNEYFPPTSLQVSNINSGTGVTNVIPQDLKVVFNLRYNTYYNHNQLQKKIEDLLKQYNLKFTLQWQHSGVPFITEKGKLIDICIQSCKEVTGIKSKISTTGGTSDGRFIAPMLKCQLIELGPLNATIHQINEKVAIDDLENLTKIYLKILEKII